MAGRQNDVGERRRELRFCDCGRPLATNGRLGNSLREATARRALELSLSADGGTSEENWLRAARELDAQYGRYP